MQSDTPNKSSSKRDEIELENIQKKETYKQLFSQSNVTERPYDTISWKVFKTRYYSLDSSIKKGIQELQKKIFDFSKNVRFSINRVIEIDSDFKRIDSKLEKIFENFKKIWFDQKKKKTQEIMLQNFKLTQENRRKEVDRLRKVFTSTKEELRVSTENENFLLKDTELMEGGGSLSSKKKEYLLDMDSEIKDAAEESELIIKQARKLRRDIRDQTENISMIDSTYLNTLNMIPGINYLIKRINQTSLRNQVIIYIVFFTCLYFLIIAIFD